MIGFPGMRADYTNWVEVRNQPYPLPPSTWPASGVDMAMSNPGWMRSSSEWVGRARSWRRS